MGHVKEPNWIKIGFADLDNKLYNSIVVLLTDDNLKLGATSPVWTPNPVSLQPEGSQIDTYFDGVKGESGKS